LEQESQLKKYEKNKTMTVLGKAINKPFDINMTKQSLIAKV